jgi:hypothetical protein
LTPPGRGQLVLLRSSHLGLAALHEQRQRGPRRGRDRNAERSGSEREELAGCCVSSDPQALPEVVDDFCFDSLRRLLAAASSRVEQAVGGLGHDCPVPPDAEASCWPLGRQCRSGGGAVLSRPRGRTRPSCARCLDDRSQSVRVRGARRQGAQRRVATRRCQPRYPTRRTGPPAVALGQASRLSQRSQARGRARRAAPSSSTHPRMIGRADRGARGGR